MVGNKASIDAINNVLAEIESLPRDKLKEFDELIDSVLARYKRSDSEMTQKQIQRLEDQIDRKNDQLERELKREQAEVERSQRNLPDLVQTSYLASKRQATRFRVLDELSLHKMALQVAGSYADLLKREAIREAS